MTPVITHAVKPAEKTSAISMDTSLRDCPGWKSTIRTQSKQATKQDCRHNRVKQIQVADCGSKPHCVRLELQKILVYGLIDSVSDITIMGGGFFKRAGAGG